MKNDQLIKKWLAEKLSPEEEQAFRQSEDYLVLSKIWDRLSVAQPPAIDPAEELERFKKGSKSDTKTVHVSWHQQLLRFAAAVALFSVLGYFIFESVNNQQILTITGAHTQQFLPDSSVVLLNKGSQLTYKPKEWSSRREVHLQGEGFFKVVLGSNFKVITSDGAVSVLGTSFNVKQLNRFFEVVCYEGKVQVVAAIDSTVLTVGKGYQKSGDETMRFNVSVGEQPGWLKGESSFYKTPFYVIINQLENQYNISVETQGVLLQRTFTGSFPNDNLKLALDAITAPSGYTYQIFNDKVRLIGEDN